jgi:hypothetical protein
LSWYSGTNVPLLDNKQKLRPRTRRIQRGYDPYFA